MPNALLARLNRAALTGLVVATVAAGGLVSARAADDGDDEMIDQKIFRHILTGLGLRDPNNSNDIEYRERAPLVVPPSRDLPPPEADSATKPPPSWPTDPDVVRRKEAAKQRQQRKREVIDWDRESRPLPASELSAAGRSADRGPALNTDAAINPSRPSELGVGSFFSFFSRNKTDGVQFEHEPTRYELTDPPPGYRTPSPNQPYGPGQAVGPAPRAITLEDRAVGEGGK